MQNTNIIKPFDDTPDTEQLKAAINGWHRPELPDGLKELAPTFSPDSKNVFRESLAEMRTGRHKRQLEVKVISWLYDFIRANIKRGRVFDLGEVLQQGSADCLGYAKLFTILGRLFGLDVGVVEVIIDNRGRYVPHTAVLVRLDHRRWQLVDLWYGSIKIKHRRVGLQVKRGSAWRIEDVGLKPGSPEEICYLPDRCVDAITLYIRGNRYLARHELDSAIKCYSEAIALYPGNARFFYNRAVAYESLGEHPEAQADYARALRDDTAIIRVLAREDSEITSLLDLDAKGIDSLSQEVYLLSRGFVTGRKVRQRDIARRLGLPETEVEAILSHVEAKLDSNISKGQVAALTVSYPLPAMRICRQNKVL